MLKEVLILKANFTGELPHNFSFLLGELSQNLNIKQSKNATTVQLKSAEILKVQKKGAKYEIYYKNTVQLCRGLSLLKQIMSGGKIIKEQQPCFETLGVMIDASRNAVMHVDCIKGIIRKFALMGVNLIMMYTEDTYEVDAYPYFGYMRGRYSYEELKELDDYAYEFGVEMCPCIQTLGHLNRAIRWPKMYHLADNAEVLLADSEATYEFIEKIVAAACRPYRSKRIHVGMDEAHGVGLGAHLQKHGYEDPHTIIKRHLSRVVEITDKMGLNAMMWSDMYFRPSSPTNSYYDAEITQKAKDSVLPNVQLVYWDYYHNTQKEYDEMFEKHKELSDNTAFAGAIWVFGGPAPDYAHTVQNSYPALNSCLKAGAKTVIATAWGDNGAEANINTILPGVQYFSEFCYTQDVTEGNLEKRFEACCNGDFSAFWNLTQFNRSKGVKSGAFRPVNLAKMLLYQDPLIQLYEQDLKGINTEPHYKKLAKMYAEHKKHGGEYRLLFEFYECLAKVLAGKSHWNNKAKLLVQNQDKKGAIKLCERTKATIKGCVKLRKTYYKLWSSTNKPYGFEIIDGRMGALTARLETACARMMAFAKGEDNMEELLQETLEYTKKEDGTLFGSYAWGEIVSACKIDI